MGTAPTAGTFHASNADAPAVTGRGRTLFTTQGSQKLTGETSKIGAGGKFFSRK